MYGVRDHFGVKPLYYLENDNQMIVSTEKKGILFSSEPLPINQEALQHYFTFQYVPNGLTLTENIKKLKPGHYFIKEINKPLKINRYFHGQYRPVNDQREEMKRRIRNVISDSVYQHMDMNQSIGSFLSGGIDSSIIATIAKEYEPNLKTFSVGFMSDGYSEVDEAKKTAEQLGIENISYIITPKEYISVLSDIIWHCEDPLADPACIPLYIVAREAKKHVNVVLSGEGADEFFGGYNIYCEPESLSIFNYVPKGVQHMLARFAKVIPDGMKGKSFLERGITSLEERYIGNAKIFNEEEKQTFIHNYNPAFTFQKITKELYVQVKEEHAVNQMQYIDLHTWLPGNILFKANKVASAHSLDIRLPFLDKEVFNIARTIPVNEKVANGQTKILLREAFKGIVPNEVLYRKKLGFPVPLKHWLKNELYAWAEELIHDSETDDILNKDTVLFMLKQHAKGYKDYARKIWTVLIFMLWYQRYESSKVIQLPQADLTLSV